MIRIFLFLLLLSQNIFSAHLPKEEGQEFESNLRIFKRYGENLHFLVEIKSRNEVEENTVKSFRTGGYVRLKKNWKLGLFYENVRGQLYSDDWNRKWQSGQWVWFWKDTSERSEDLYTIDLTYRSQLDSNWVFELKNRFTYNEFNSNKFIRIRPGATYFWKKDAMPFINWFLQYEIYLPLSDYSDETIYERWGYAGLLYHLHSNYKIGAFMARKKVIWDTVTVKSNVLGLNFFVYF